MNDFMGSFTAGGISGAIAKTCTAPIERVKLLLQNQNSNPRIISGEVIKYSGLIDCFRRVFKEQGVTAFWRGNLTNCIRYFPTQALNFAFKDSVKANFPKANKRKEFRKFVVINVVSGGIAGAGCLMIVYPLEYTRTRLASDLQAEKQIFRGLIDYVLKTVRKGSILSLYRGVSVSLIGIIPYRGTYFGLFDTLSALNPHQHSNETLTRAGSKFVCAQTSATTAAYVFYPFDTIRRRLQIQSEQEQQIYKGTIDCFTTIVREEGPAYLFKGAAVNALRTVGAAFVLVLYSEISPTFR